MKDAFSTWVACAAFGAVDSLAAVVYADMTVQRIIAMFVPCFVFGVLALMKQIQEIREIQ
jgi:hypothetical protein